MAEKLVFMVTKGPAEAELATVPFVMAAAALASDVEVVMFIVEITSATNALVY